MPIIVTALAVIIVFIALFLLISWLMRKDDRDNSKIRYALYFDIKKKIYVEREFDDDETIGETDVLKLITTDSKPILYRVEQFMRREHYKPSTIRQARNAYQDYEEFRCTMKGEVK